MYNKLFTKILDSTIWLAPDGQRLVWITLIAAMDEDGNALFACPENLAARARQPLDVTIEAITAFENPDPRDPDQEYEGRRIERIPGGWHLLNGKKYRDMATKETMRASNAERVRRFRERRRTEGVTLADVTSALHGITPQGPYPTTPLVHHEPIGNGSVMQSEAYAEADTEKNLPQPPLQGVTPVMPPNPESVKAERQKRTKPRATFDAQRFPTVTVDLIDMYQAYRVEQGWKRLGAIGLTALGEKLAPCDALTQKAMIDQSIANGWQGVFPLPARGPGTPAAAPVLSWRPPDDEEDEHAHA